MKSIQINSLIVSNSDYVCSLLPSNSGII